MLRACSVISRMLRTEYMIYLVLKTSKERLINT